MNNQKKSGDGIDRRGFLDCMKWAGTAVVWSLAGGVPRSRLAAAEPEKSRAEDFSFVQISDSHIGFNKPANPDVRGTLQAAVEKINGLGRQPEFVIHTGDLTHLARPSEFDDLDQVLKGLRQRQMFAVPGEHDVSGDDGKEYRARFGGDRHSFEHKGVRFLGLNNVAQLEGMGKLGAEQLAWLKREVHGLSASTPIVLFAHIPLWSVYPAWGWGTEDSAEALAMLRRFGSVTVLNGHIHQVMQKVEGNVAFHTAMSTAFPQPAPGSAPAAGPMKVPAERLREALGISDVSVVAQKGELAVVDRPLGGGM